MSREGDAPSCSLATISRPSHRSARRPCCYIAAGRSLTEPLMITPGRCYVNIAVFRAGDLADYVERAAYFDIDGADVYGTGKIPPREWVMFVVAQRWSS